MSKNKSHTHAQNTPPRLLLGSAGHFKVSQYSLVAPAGALYLGPTHLAVATSRGPQKVTNFEAAPLLAASKIWHVFEISSGSCKLRTGQKASEGKNLCSHHGPVKWAIYIYIYIYICLYLFLCLGCYIHTSVYLSSIYLSKNATWMHYSLMHSLHVCQALEPVAFAKSFTISLEEKKLQVPRFKHQTCMLNGTTLISAEVSNKTHSCANSCSRTGKKPRPKLSAPFRSQISLF